MAAPTPLPDDIIHLIVDEIASSGDLTSLRACAAVSWAVNSYARKHLFSDIQFLLDSSANKRAKRLVQLLRHPRNQDLHTRIRSLTVVVGDVPAEGTRAVIQKSRASLRKAVANLVSPTVDYVSILFQLFSNISLTAFTLKPQFNTEDLESHSQTVIAHWPTLCEKMPAGVLSGLIHNIACKPGLQSLTFRWIWGMPVTLLIGSDISTSLQKLNIHRSSFTPGEAISEDDSRRFSKRVNDLKALTLIAQGPVLQLILPLEYPSLTTITVNIPSQPDELSRLLQLLSSASRTLISLTLQNLASFGKPIEL